MSSWVLDKRIKIRQIFDKRVYGYWDGGDKTIFNWSFWCYDWKNVKKGDRIEVGSWQANYYFIIKAGNNLEQTILKAIRHIQKITKTKVGYTIQVIRSD